MSDFEGDGALSMLACDACAARSFPETSVDTAGKIRFKFGDDGPVMAMDVALDIPKIHVDFQPSGEAISFPKEGGKGNDCSGSISVDVEGFELTYKRTANRLGGLESSLRSVTINDPDPGIAFHRPLAPGLYEELIRGNFRFVSLHSKSVLCHYRYIASFVSPRRRKKTIAMHKIYSRPKIAHPTSHCDLTVPS